MDNVHPRYTGNQNGLTRDKHESSSEGRGSPASPQHGLNSAPLPPIEQTIFDRLNITLEQGQTERVDSPQKHALDELGREIQQWRLQLGYTRAVLAGKLQMNINKLICIENGIAQTDDISTRQLLTLKDLLSKGEAAPLKAAIQQYLISLRG